MLPRLPIGDVLADVTLDTLEGVVGFLRPFCFQLCVGHSLRAVVRHGQDRLRSGLPCVGRHAASVRWAAAREPLILQSGTENIEGKKTMNIDTTLSYFRL